MTQRTTRKKFALQAVMFAAFAGAMLFLFSGSNPPQPAAALAAAPVAPPVESFADLAEKLLPTVVNISTTQTIEAPQQGMPNMPNLPPGSPFEDMFRDFFEQYEGMPQMQERQTASLGSGFIIDTEKGYIVTNNHVIRDSDEIKVILQDDTTLDATVIGMDEKTDIAVLQVKTDKKLIAARWGDSEISRVGDWVLAIGNPFGLGGTVTAGIISASRRDINAGPYDDFIQTDASINRGNSGGPMFNLKGEIIGVNTAIFSPSGGSVGIGFAVPSSLVRPVVEQLIKYGQTRRGWLGVRIQQVTDEIAESLGLKEAYGALVSSVTESGPAAAAGLQQGDIILSFDGKRIKQMRELPRMVAESEIGKQVELHVWRKGKTVTAKVKLGQLEKAEENGLVASESEMPDEDSGTGDADKVSALGLTVSPVNRILQQRYNIGRDATGVVVTEIDPAGIAAGKGVAPGDLIIEVDQQPVKSVKDVQKAVTAAEKEKKRSVLLLVSRGGEIRFIALRLKS